MTDVSVLPQTSVEAQTAFLAFAAILGGGFVAYEAGRAIREGDLFKTDAVPPNATAGFFSMTAGIFLTGIAVKDAAAEVGWKPLIFGSAGIGAAVAIARWLRS